MVMTFACRRHMQPLQLITSAPMLCICDRQSIHIPSAADMALATCFCSGFYLNFQSCLSFILTVALFSRIHHVHQTAADVSPSNY